MNRTITLTHDLEAVLNDMDDRTLVYMWELIISSSDYKNRIKGYAKENGWEVKGQIFLS